MNKNFIISLFLAFSLVSYGMTTTAIAQEDRFNQPPAQTEDRVGNPNAGVSWLWLLPLLAIPLFFVFRRDAGYQDHDLTGAKGGRSEDRYDDRV